MVDISDSMGAVQRARPRSRLRRALRGGIHFFSYHLFLKRRRTAVARAHGFRLVVPPTVFHPSMFLSGFFARFVSSLDLAGKRVAEVGTGSGILALSAARAGAQSVVAIDINPNAARAVSENARDNGFGERVFGVCSNLLSALAPRPLFDVIISNPPWFPGEPRDLADRAWHAGSDYAHIAALFTQSRDRLAPGGCMYLMLSSDADLGLLGKLIAEARLRARLVKERSIVIESLIVYELRAH